MKSRCTLLILPAVFIPLALIAQGPLTPPPGAPAPLMKSLQQVEPRTDVATLAGDATAVFVITAPGSYYLSGKVTATAGKAGIAIAAADVSLDLNGFAVTGAAGVTNGVELRNGANGATIRNGVISGVAAGPGVATAPGALLTNGQLEGLTIRNCAGGAILPNFQGLRVERVRVSGCTSSGLDVGGGATVSHCVVDSTVGSAVGGLYGIRAGVVHASQVTQLTNSAAFGVGIFAPQVQDCAVSGVTGSGNGVLGIFGDNVTACKVTTVRNTGTGTMRGISSNGKVSDCEVEGIGDAGPGSPIGIFASHVSGCHVTLVGGADSTANQIGGIIASISASHCTVITIGASNAPQPLTGLQTGLATHCRVADLDAARSITGINAITAISCNVDGLSQGAGASGSMHGISADTVTDCRVAQLNGVTATGTSAFSFYKLATGCTASGIANSGGGFTIGFAPGANGYTVNCTVESTGSFGVNGISGCTVKGCTIRLNSSGIGIELSGTGGMIQDNFVHFCATGINASGTKILVVRNRVSDCTANISSSATTQTGPMVTATGTIASTNPWANFTN
jgi:hypothetical protein